MDRVKGYIYHHFSLIFFSVFIPLFFIASIIFLVKIAAVTALVQLSIYDMGQMYLFILPELLFYTLPIAFFIGATMTFAKLSFDYEMVVLFALGVAPSRIVKIMLSGALILSLLLLYISLVLVPHTTQMYKTFLKVKKSQANFNIKPSEFGQKFGDWHIYIGEQDEDNKKYSDIALFNQNRNSENLILASQAQIVNNDGVLQFRLYDGRTHLYKNREFSVVNFDTMNINDSATMNTKPYVSPINYWLQDDSRRPTKFATNVLVSLFPPLSILIILSIGIIHTRSNKNPTYLYMFIAVTLFYALSFTLAKKFGISSIAIVIGIWLLGSALIYRRKIVPVY